MAADPGPRPPELADRLRDFAARHRGATAVAMRTQQIPASYRAFFRQVGLDPDLRRPPGEQAAVDRLLHGGFRSRDRIHDACLVALLDTGVPVWALDAELVDEQGLGIRIAADGDAFVSSAGHHVSAGEIVVADDHAVHAVLFEDPLPGHAAGPGTEALLLFSLAVDGVPMLHVEEALTVAAEWLGA